MVVAVAHDGLSDSRAQTVCLSCKERKQKCDRSLPSCTRCERLLLKCRYPEPRVYSSRTTSSGSESVSCPSPVIDRDQALANDLRLVFDGSQSGLPQLGDLVSKHREQFEAMADVFLSSCQKWVPIIHRHTFREHCKAPQTELPQGFLALILSMGLMTRPLMDGDRPDSLRESMYVAARRLFWDVESVAQPTLALIQCGLLLSAYEYGQGLLNASYVTICVCSSMAQISGLCPTQHPPSLPLPGPWAPQDEGLRTWWGILIHERMISLKSGVPIRPLGISDSEVMEGVDVEAESRFIVSNIDLDPLYASFYLQARAATWLELVLDVTRSPQTRSSEGRLRFQNLDRGLLLFLMTLVQLGLGSCCEAIAISLSAFIHLHRWRLTCDSPFFSQQDYLESSRAIETILKVLSDLAQHRAESAISGEDNELDAEQFPYFIHMIYQLLIEMRQQPRLQYRPATDTVPSHAFEKEMSLLYGILLKQTDRWQISREYLAMLDGG
ncbi:hypothetical protein ASPZODRAFT_135200 [Penicilliopsis zonata CBS 506.65]|uniref:Zn(2)-C6 fungal-type domain-containing protein n=1 Tax=Penicilliopsis zonata CBS 506.65 TaxID=1073090 RepID=A0A1L9SB26_9EURO|nr:hypothetical protein ASPZODRAFT_135200 [Penicilliopsis zonata CBS 506.65]OJJ44382.1 hypothetical protein ASPZODRAFT_135200 [Penicilliopsis zonata CBS 506.65]